MKNQTAECRSAPPLTLTEGHEVSPLPSPKRETSNRIHYREEIKTLPLTNNVYNNGFLSNFQELVNFNNNFFQELSEFVPYDQNKKNIYNFINNTTLETPEKQVELKIKNHERSSSPRKETF